MSDTETAYALALIFDLLPTSEQRRRAGIRLDELVRESGYHIRTGFVGTPLISDALCSTGHYVAAYHLLMQQECPSWLFPVTMGATTVWERWDSMLPDGSINPGEMTSFNHYALGAVADWMHRTIGGLIPAQPGYRHMEIRPRPGGGLTHAKARHVTPYGLAECDWKIEDGKFDLDVIIPPNTTALVTFPGSDATPVEVSSGTWHWSISYQDLDARGPFTVDDLTGDIMSDKRAGSAILGVLTRVGVPDFMCRIILEERNVPLHQSLRMLPQYEDATQMMNEALASL
jgi:alpha-L-rhamnosidase